MIFGCGLREMSDDGLLQLREVTFAGDPGVLREIAAFLNYAAGRMDEGRFCHPNRHLHIQSCVKEWDRRFPAQDVIATAPVADAEEDP